MLTFRGSPARDPYEECLPRPRYVGEDNVAWLARQMEDLAPNDERTYVVLVGGTGLYDYRLRVAQSHLRSDLSPSHWSHTFLLRHSESPTPESDIIEASLEPVDGFATSVRFNGIQYALLSRYADPVEFPNVALLEVPLNATAWRKGTKTQKTVLRQFSEQRVTLDVTTLFLSWLGYVWCAGDAANPLLDGHGIPSAALIDAILGTSGYDVSPALESSFSSPEAFWQSARWWQAYVAETGLDPMRSRFTITDLQLPDFGLLRPADIADDGRADDAASGTAPGGGEGEGGQAAQTELDVTFNDQVVAGLSDRLFRAGVAASSPMRLQWRQPPEGLSLPVPRPTMSRTERLLAEDT